MSQYCAMLYIRVRTPEDFKKLQTIRSRTLEEAGLFTTAAKLFAVEDGDEGTEFVADGEWSCTEEDMMDLIEAVVEREPACAILAAVTNINVDPYTDLFTYFGDEIEEEMHDISEDGCDMEEIDDPFGEGTMWGFFNRADISDFEGCLKDIDENRGLGFNEIELENLEQLGMKITQTDETLQVEDLRKKR